MRRSDYEGEINELLSNSRKFNRIVIWGFRHRFHTHRYIHKSMYKTLRSLGVNVIWVEDKKSNQKLIKAGDLIIGGDMYGRMMPEKLTFEDYNIPIRDDIFYCLYHFKNIFIDKVNRNRLLILEPHRDGRGISDIQLDEITYLDTKSSIRTLYQAWGTDVMPWKFRPPVYNLHRFVFWIGSVWNDKNNQGNVHQIAELKGALKKRGLKFVHLRFVSSFINMFLIRLSRLAPAIGGRHQVETGYLPCRMFKNISYGQLGFSNIERFRELYKGCSVPGSNIDELIENALRLSRDEYKNMVVAQQAITRNHTYLQKMNNIFRAFQYGE